MTKMQNLAKLIEEMDNLLGHIEGINDERELPEPPKQP
jgi:hypothetical protein